MDSKAKRRTSTRTVVLILIGSGILGLVLTAAAVRWRRQAVGETLRRAQAAQEAGLPEEAYRLLSAVLESHPERLDLARAAGIAALGSGHLPEAVRYAHLAWQGGLRDEAVLETLIAADPLLAGEAGHERALAYIRELPDERSQLRLRIRMHVRAQEWAEALPLLKDLYGRDGDPTVRRGLAEAYIHLNRFAEAVDLMEEPGRSGALASDGYRLLAFALLQAAEGEGGPDIHVRIADLMEDARGAGVFDAALAFDAAQYALIAGDAPRARTALDDVQEGPSALDAAVLQMIVDQAIGAESVSESRPLSGPSGEAVRLLAAAVEGDDPDALVFAGQKVQRLVGTRPAIQVLVGLHLLRWGDAVRAEQSLAQVRGLLARAPLVALGRAHCLIRLGRQDEAQAVLLDLHRRLGPTKQSLLMLTQLSAHQWTVSQRHQVQRLSMAGGDRDLDHLGRALARQEALDWMLGPSPTPERRASLQRQVASINAADPESLTSLDGLGLSTGPTQFLRGLALQRLGRHREALPALQAAREAGAPMGIHGVEALSYVALGDEVKARQAALEALSEDPKDELSWRVLADVSRSKEQCAALDEALSRSPLNHGDRLALSALAALRGGDEAAARTQAEAALANEPAPPSARLVLVDLALARQDWDQALAHLNDLNPRSDDLLLRRLAAEIGRGDAAAASGTWSMLSPAEGKRQEASGLAVQIALLRQDLGAARAAADRLGEPKRTVWLARVLRLQGRDSAARLVCEERLDQAVVAGLWLDIRLALKDTIGIAERIAATDLDGPAIWALAGQARMAGYTDLEADLLVLAHARAPTQAVIANDWAWAGFQSKRLDLDQALKLIAVARAGLPDSATCLDTHAQILLAAGKEQEALGVLESRLDLVERHLDLRWCQIQALIRIGDTAQAKVLLTQALALADQVWPSRFPRSVWEETLRGLDSQ